MHGFRTVAHTVIGSGASADIASHLTASVRAEVRRVLLVSDAHLLSLGLLRPALDGLAAAGIDVISFTDVVPDPPEQLALDCVALARREKVDAVVAIGGGSSMDLAKVAAVMAYPDCTQSITALYGVDQVDGPRLPLLLAPSTAGTGSEVTPIAIITTGETTKAGIVSPWLYADVALLDPALTTSLPPQVAAVTAIDAMVHAIEAYTSKIKKNPLSDQHALSALTLLSTNILPACKPGPPEQVRENMLLGAMLAGQAFANAPVAAIHALAYPLGGHCHLSHGLSNALMMVPVMRFNLPYCAPLYAELARHLALVPVAADEISAAQALIDYIESTIASLGIEPSLRAHGIEKTFLPTLAGDAMLQTRLLVNNPREVSEQDALALYHE
ncbi:MAG: iron-containing alcohol dehydrogenase, partial [Pseudomonadales bacterium]|nr:iron-containing alcohol dehydrogenase [Pseudomonadales bacterium]